MYSLILDLLQAQGFNGLAAIGAYGVSVFLGLIICFIARGIIRQLLAGFFKTISEKTENIASSWAAALLKNGFIAWTTNLIIPISLLLIASDIGQHTVFWNRLVETMLIGITVLLVNSVIQSIGDIYYQHEVSKVVPLRSGLQLLEIVVFVVGFIIIISVFVDKNPSALLGSLGAMTAIITIVFKDTILGFVAGIQLAANDMVQVGDTIEMPQRTVAGTVMDISLTTVKVQDFDKTIVSIPAYALITEPFVNRRGILAAGTRRIMRSFQIDSSSVRICDDDMTARFMDIPLISDYMHTKVNDKDFCMTNIGAFREYITAYLKSREDIDAESTLLVRQLQAEDRGIPLEIYAFAAVTDMVSYENIQSDIFDHIYANIKRFDLKLYQNPSSQDFQLLAEKM